MNELPTYELELRAADERKRLHNTLEELKERMHETLDVKSKVRHHPWLFSGVAGLIAAGAGYSLAGLFTRR